MSVFRREYAAAGKRRKSKTWTSVFRFKGKTYTRGGFVDRATAEFWESQKKVSLGRGEVGMPDTALRSKSVPLVEVIDEFIGELAKLKRDSMYVYTTEKRLKRVADEAGWLQLRDVNLPEFNAWRFNPPTDRGRKRIKSADTLNQYLDHWRQFMEWCVRRSKVTQNAFARVDPINSPEATPYRRAATPDEVRQLLASVSPDRKFFYLFVLYTPLRRETLAQLAWGDLHLNDKPAWLRIRSETVKSRRIEKSAIRADLVPELRKRQKAADEPVFDHVPTVEEIRTDWESAGVTFSDKHDRSRLDLHAFRKTAIKWMKAAGVSLEEASLVLHHKDLRTTKKHYDEDTMAPPLVDAVEKMAKIE